jgi:hypothetical protein
MGECRTWFRATTSTESALDEEGGLGKRRPPCPCPPGCAITPGRTTSGAPWSVNAASPSPRRSRSSSLAEPRLRIARDGGWTATSSGFELGPIVGTAAKRPLYVDAQGHVLVLVINPNFTTGPYECWDFAAGQKVNALGTYAPHNYGFFQLGVSPSRSDVIIAAYGGPSGTTAQFFRGGCGIAGQSLGSLTAPPPSFSPSYVQQGLWPLLSNGDLVYPTTNGSLARLSFAGASPAASVFVSSASLDTALGQLLPGGGVPSGARRFLSFVTTPDEHIWTLVEHTDSLNATKHWLVEVAPNGTATARLGPASGLPRASWAPPTCSMTPRSTRSSSTTRP